MLFEAVFQRCFNISIHQDPAANAPLPLKAPFWPPTAGFQGHEKGSLSPGGLRGGGREGLCPAQEHRAPRMTVLKHLQPEAGLGTEGPPSHKPCLEMLVATPPHTATISGWQGEREGS